MACSTALLSSFLLLFLLCSPSSARDGNMLLTGDVLTSNEHISIDNSVFIIENDCNLVLYNKGKGFQSNTSGQGTKCTLTLSHYGQLFITDVITNKVLWSSPSSKVHSKGYYAAILQPDGEVGIYGPAVWTTPGLSSEEVSAHDSANMRSDDAPSDANLLFSSEVLKEGSKVTSGDYALAVTKQCSLRLTKSAHDNTIVWESRKFSARKNCFARLNFHGQLALIGDDNKVLWNTTKAAAAKEPYVLAVKLDGQATIYAPRFWSTAAQ